jgi:ATP-dependent Lon protease
MAAQAAGLTDIILPDRNEPDLDDLPSEVREQMHFHPVKSVDEVLAVALQPSEVVMVA